MYKKILDLDFRNKLIQFLMGLNSGYDAIRNQILDTDPLPTVNRAHYIIQQQEKQMKLRENIQIKLEVEAHTVYKLFASQQEG